MKLLQENKLTKYLAYAMGEIVLVVIGILIALQISNWNQERQEKASLEAYLTSISRNVESDLTEIEALSESRQKISSRIPYLWDNLNILNGDGYLSIEELTLYSSTAFKLMDLNYFIPDLSGYDSLKNSGFLNKLQGTELELLLYQYYSLIEEVKLMEGNYNDVLHEAAQQYRAADLKVNFYFYTPSFIDPDEFDELQEPLYKIITHNSITQLFNQAGSQTGKLLAMYDNLSIIGQQLKRLINNQQKSFDEQAIAALNNIYDFNGNIGYPRIMRDGAFNESFFLTGYSQSEPSDIWALSALGEGIVKFKEMAWGIQYFTVDIDTTVARPSKDYSVYKTLRIEAKAPVDGQTLLVIVKDADDPDDGSETRVPITLSTEWQYYDIPLSTFESTDFSRVYMPVGFVFLEKAQEVRIRHIEYLK